MKQKNLIIECLTGAEGIRNFIVREVPEPNKAPSVLAVCTGVDDLCGFFETFDID